MARTKTTYADKKAYITRDFGQLVGKKIVEVRPLTEKECEMFAWDYDRMDYAMVLICQDGTAIIPSCDPEGNGAGFLFVEKVG